MDIIRACFYDFYFHFFTQLTQNLTYTFSQLIVYYFPPILRCKDDMIHTSVAWMRCIFHLIFYCCKASLAFFLMRSSNLLYCIIEALFLPSFLFTSGRTRRFFSPEGGQKTQPTDFPEGCVFNINFREWRFLSCQILNFHLISASNVNNL